MVSKLAVSVKNVCLLGQSFSSHERLFPCQRGMASYTYSLALTHHEDMLCSLPLKSSLILAAECVPHYVDGIICSHVLGHKCVKLAAAKHTATHCRRGMAGAVKQLWWCHCKTLQINCFFLVDTTSNVSKNHFIDFSMQESTTTVQNVRNTLLLNQRALVFNRAPVQKYRYLQSVADGMFICKYITDTHKYKPSNS